MRLEVCPALGARLLPAGAAAEDSAEEIAEVVTMLADLARTLGREVATQDQARELLGLG